MEKTTKIEVTIDKNWLMDFSAEFKMSECLFSTSDRTIDADEFISRLKKVLRKSDGFDMLTIDVTYGESYYGNGREVIASYRFVNRSTGMEFSMASPSTSWHFHTWQTATIKDLYKFGKICVECANRQHIKGIRQALETI